MLLRTNRQIVACYSAVMLSMTMMINAEAGETTRISVTPTGGQASGYKPSMNADGRIVTMNSDENLSTSPDDFNTQDIFYFDRITNQSKMVDLSSAGVKANSYGPNTPIVSADGRFVVFASYATNLVAGATGGIFVRDTQLNKTTLINMSSSGIVGNGSSELPSINTDGRYVSFRSSANNLVSGDTNNADDIFVRDRVTNKTTRVSVSSTGAQGNGYSFENSISGNGRYVAFSSTSSNLVVGDTNGNFGNTDIFVRDTTTNQTTRVNLDSNGNQSSDSAERPSISADGRFVAFLSRSNLVAGTPFSGQDVFIRDRQTNTTVKSPLNVPNILPLNTTPSFSKPVISADGRYVVFALNSFDYFFGNDAPLGVYVFDRVANTTARVDKSSANVVANSLNADPVISADGRYVAFESNASNLVAGDTNGAADIFYHDRSIDKTQNADLSITVIQKPASLVLNTSGTFVYRVTNNSTITVNAISLIHVLSNASNLSSIVPSQGSCTIYANISRCALNSLLPGANLTVTVTALAERNPVTQRVTVSAPPVDTIPSNNRSNLETLVTP